MERRPWIARYWWVLALVGGFAILWGFGFSSYVNHGSISGPEPYDAFEVGEVSCDWDSRLDAAIVEVTLSPGNGATDPLILTLAPPRKSLAEIKGAIVLGPDAGWRVGELLPSESEIDHEIAPADRLSLSVTHETRIAIVLRASPQSFALPRVTAYWTGGEPIYYQAIPLDVSATNGTCSVG